MQRINDQLSLGSTLNNLGIAYTWLKKILKMLLYVLKKYWISIFRLAIKIWSKINILFPWEYYLQQGENEKTKPYMFKGLLLYKEIKVHEIKLIGTNGLLFF